MRAMILRDGELRVDDLPEPVPGAGHVLVRTLACGVCASDIHLQAHGTRLAEWSKKVRGPFDMDMKQDIVMGHEFCAEIVGYGPETERRHPIGTRITSVPLLFHADGMAVLGYDNHYPGGFSECMLLNERSILPVPDSLDSDAAALSEPVSIGFQFVRVADPQPEDVPLVVGCGMIGLAMIAALNRAGAGPIVASDFSSTRRELAARVGADELVDPAQESPFAVWRKTARSRKGARALIFECVGVPGVLGSILEEAPINARVMVAGVCLEPETIPGFAALNRGLNVQFGVFGTPADFENALRAIGDGSVDVEAWLTGSAPLEQSVEAFDAAKNPETHARMIIHPSE